MVISSVRCKISHKGRYFAPVDSNIRSITLANLEKLYQGFLNEGCELSDYPRLPQLIFSPTNKSFKARFKLLKVAQQSLLNEASPEQKGKAQPDEGPSTKRRKA